MEPYGSSVPHTRLVKLADGNPLPAFITYSDANGIITVSISDPQYTGIYQINVIANEPGSGKSNADIVFKLTLKCTIKYFHNTLVGVKNLVYEVYPGENPAVLLTKPQYSTEPSYCLVTPYELKIEREPADLKIPDFIKIASTQISIQTDDPANGGEYIIKFAAKETRTGFIDTSVMFKLVVICRITNLKPKITSQTKLEIIYPIRSAPLTFAMPEYVYEPLICKTPLVYELINTSDGKTSLLYPGFFKFDLKQLSVTLAGDKEMYELRDKEFRFRLKVTTEDGL